MSRVKEKKKKKSFDFSIEESRYWKYFATEELRNDRNRWKLEGECSTGYGTEREREKRRERTGRGERGREKERSVIEREEREEKERRAVWRFVVNGRTPDEEREVNGTWNMSGVCGEPCTLPRDRYGGGGIPASGM